MQFIIHMNRLKSMIEQVVSCITKKDYINIPIVLEVKNNKLYMRATNYNQYIQVVCKVDNACNGIASISYIDLLSINNLTGYITFIVNDNISIISNKQKMIFVKQDFIFDMPENKDMTEAIRLKANDLFLIFNDMYSLASHDASQTMYNCINFSILHKQIEVVDSARISIKKFSNDINSTIDNVTIPLFSIKPLKKVLYNKNDICSIYVNQEFIQVRCKECRYITKQLDGTFMNVNKFFELSTPYSYVIDDINLYNVMKNYVELNKQDKGNFVFTKYNNELYSIFTSNRHFIINKIYTKELNYPNDVSVAYNPLYIMQVLKIIDAFNPVIKMTKDYTMYIEGNKYKFMILPLKLTEDITPQLHKEIANYIKTI